MKYNTYALMYIHFPCRCLPGRKLPAHSALASPKEETEGRRGRRPYDSDNLSKKHLQGMAPSTSLFSRVC